MQSQSRPSKAARSPNGKAFEADEMRMDKLDRLEEDKPEGLEGLNERRTLEG
jgi:hypothetical protein